MDRLNLRKLWRLSEQLSHNSVEWIGCDKKFQNAKTFVVIMRGEVFLLEESPPCPSQYQVQWLQTPDKEARKKLKVALLRLRPIYLSEMSILWLTHLPVSLVPGVMSLLSTFRATVEGIGVTLPPPQAQALFDQLKKSSGTRAPLTWDREKIETIACHPRTYVGATARGLAWGYDLILLSLLSYRLFH